MARIGLATFPLPRECSTTELHRHAKPRRAQRHLCGRGRTCTCEGETPLDLQSSAFAAQPHAHYINLYHRNHSFSITLPWDFFHSSIFLWSPDNKTSGTRHFLHFRGEKISGLVYCAYSKNPPDFEILSFNN